MSFHYLESADDPRVADYTQLTDVHLRKLREPAEGMYIAESSRVLRRALAAGHRPRSFFLAEKWLADLQDVLGAYPDVPAFIGSAAALDIDAVLISPHCGDPLYRRSVRVSMGTVFQVPWARLESWPQDISVLKQNGFTVAALELTGDAVDVDQLAARNPDRLALVLGTEGAGMSAETLAAVDLAVKIPMRAGVDSLNVAAASAVAFWELRPRD